MLEIVTNSSDETSKVGYKLGNLLTGGDLVCLIGDLGTGKTAFTGGIAQALGIEGYITSPTFTIVNEYEGKKPLYHFDVYRVADSMEMYEIGFEEYLSSNGIVVIEWADIIKDILPSERITVTIMKDYKVGSEVRKIKIEFTGERYAEYEGRLQG